MLSALKPSHANLCNHPGCKACTEGRTAAAGKYIEAAFATIMKHICSLPSSGRTAPVARPAAAAQRHAAAVAPAGSFDLSPPQQHHACHTIATGQDLQSTYDASANSRPGTNQPRRQWLSALVAAAVAVPLLSLWPSPVDAKVPPVKDPASNVGYLSDKDVDKQRKKANFLRAYDGHVAIQNRYTKAWTDIKCDLQVPGLLLLRDASGEVFYLGYGGLKQIDLSDDQVVAAIAKNDWENQMQPVEGPGEGGAVERLEMTREGFYQLVSLTSGEDFEAELVPQETAQKLK